MSPHGPLVQALGRLAAMQARRVWRRRILWGSVLAQLFIGLAIALAQVGLVGPAALTSCAIALFCVIFVAVTWALTTRPMSADKALVTLKKHDPPRHRKGATNVWSATQTALALDLKAGNKDEAPNFSLGLARAHVSATLDKLAADDVAQALRKHHQRATTRLTLVVGATSMALAVTMLAFSTGTMRLWRTASAWPPTMMMSGAWAADIVARLRYPPYIQRPDVALSAIGGALEVPVGAQVRLEAEVLGTYTEAGLVLLPAPQGKAQPTENDATQTGRHRIFGTVRANAHGTRSRIEVSVTPQDLGTDNQPKAWAFFATTPFFTTIIDGQWRLMRTLLDQAPKVTFVSPQNDQIVEPQGQMTIQWRAIDDYGFSSLQMLIKAPRQNEQALTLGVDDTSTTEDGWRVASGHLNIDLKDWALVPGDTVELVCTATDTDTLNGPKTSQSEPLHLSVPSGRALHEMILTRAHAWHGKLIDVLADETENLRPTADALTKRLAEVKRLHIDVTALIAQVAETPLVRQALAIALNAMQSHSQRAQMSLSDPEHNTLEQARKRIATWEADVLYLDDLLVGDAADGVRDTADELRDSKDQLSQLMSSIKEQKGQAPSPAMQQMMAQKVKLLTEQIQNLLQRAQNLRQKAPEDFYNVGAKSDSPMQQTLERLDKDVAANDLAQAEQELAHLGNLIEEMLKNLDAAEAGFDEAHLAATRQNVQQVAQQIHALSDKQDDLHKQAQALNQARRKEALKGDTAEAVLKKAQQALQDAATHAESLRDNPSATAVLGDLAEHAAKDIHEANEVLALGLVAQAHDGLMHNEPTQHFINETLKQTRGAKTQRGPLQKADDDAQAVDSRTHSALVLLQQLMQADQQPMSPVTQNKAESLQKQQQSLASEAKAMNDTLRALDEQAPVLGNKQQQTLGEAQQKMQAAQDHLNNNSTQQAQDAMQQATNALKQVGQKLTDDMPQRGPGRASKPQNKKLNSQQPRHNDHDEQNVQMPDKDMHDKRATLKRKVKEASKQPPPQAYQEAVRHYYQELLH